MANALTMQLRPTKKYSAPSVANLFHNSGLSKATYWLKDSNNIISNLDLKNLTTRRAVNLWKKWEEEATNLVIKNKGKNPQKKQVLIEEGLLVIGKDVLEKDPQVFIKIFEEFKKWFEKKYNTKIVAWFFHNHEGHINKEGEFSENLHIHFFFLNVDLKGNSVRRQIKKSDLSLFQDKIFEIGKKYIPTLQRAKNYFKEGKKAPKHKSHRQYRTEKEREKEQKLIAKVKDLKELNKQIKKEFKKLGAKREDYARLEALNKELKEKIKKKELSIEEMQEKFNQELQKLKELAYSKKYTYQNTKKPVPNLKVANYFEKKSQELEEKLKEEEEKTKKERKEKEVLKEKIKKLEEELDFFKRKFEYTENYTKAPKKQNFNLGYFYYLREMQLDATAYFQYENIFKDAKEVELNEIDKVRKVKIETENSTLIDTGDAIQLKAILNKKINLKNIKSK